MKASPTQRRILSSTGFMGLMLDKVESYFTSFASAVPTTILTYELVYAADLFADIQPFVQSAFDGFNVTVFAYGQTSSGKTHTMVCLLLLFPMLQHFIDNIFTNRCLLTGNISYILHDFSDTCVSLIMHFSFYLFQRILQFLLWMNCTKRFRMK